ncbi:MAG: hypothetical protein K6G42_10695 [Lachnospiraceae bacterium]|nr:hypothetical protein [Lachnospiraceae bacterium]
MTDKKVKRYIRLFVMTVTVTALSLVSMGLDFLSRPVVLDVNKYRVYESSELDRILKACEDDFKTAKAGLNDTAHVVTGKVGSKKENNKEFEITPTSGNSGDVLVCRASDQNIEGEIASLKTGDTVQVYGRIVFDIIGWGMHMETDAIYAEAESEKETTGTRSFSNRYTVRETMAERSLDNGRIVYDIPASWKKSEDMINRGEGGLGLVEGYRYVLENPDNRTTGYDSLFICFFDKDLLENPEDIQNPRQVERVIVSNILGDDADLTGFPMKTAATRYGSGEKYQYYKGVYRPDILTSPYRVEFVFQPVRDEGILFYLYLYDSQSDKTNDSLVRDIIYVMSSTKLK